MNKTDLVTLFTNLELPKIPDEQSNICDALIEEKTLQVYRKLNCNQDDIFSFLESTTKHYFSNPDLPEWKYLMANIYVLSQLGSTLEDSNNKEILSVKEVGQVKHAVASLIKMSIYTKLLPKLPYSIMDTYPRNNDIFYEYNILKCTILAFCNLLKNDHLRLIIFTEGLKGILTGLYQIAFCPIKKDLEKTHPGVYNTLQEEKKMALTMIKNLKENIHPNIYVKDTMIIFQENSPPWFKKAVSQTLTSIMLSSNGIESVAVAMLSGTGQDNARTWKALDVLFRLISTCKLQPNFKTNICKQVIKLLDKTDEESLIFERLYVICTKRFYYESIDIGKDIFLRKIMSTALHFTRKGEIVQEGSCSELVKKNIRLLHAVFIENTVDCKCLPVDILKPILSVIFRIYNITLNSVFKTTNNEARALLLTYLEQQLDQDIIVFDSLLHDINVPFQILPFSHSTSISIEANEIILKYCEHTLLFSVAENAEALLKLLEDKTLVLKRLFVYLLGCLNNRQKYFKKVNEALLCVESDVMNQYFERSLAVYRLLSALAEDKAIQTAIVESPEEIVLFIHKTLQNAIEKNIHKTVKYENNDEFQTLFTIIMILNSLIRNDTKNTVKKFESLIESLQVIKQETSHNELATLIAEILRNLDSSKPKATRIHIEDVKNNLDVVLEDICDPLLPVRGHGLMSLKKLVKKKDSSVMERKQYVLTIFQQNLKNEDSFIYLSAIDGLAVMADIFPDTVLNILCEEYSDFTKKDKDSNEVRMKLGEVLVRVTKDLGEMAPKYKSLLLNTLLDGTKDDDHLVRASALSNLAELCRVLGYKLGTVITEVLVCVHAVITTDKAIEARRAAVTVIRQLLVGLQSEMIAFLKDDILPIYRTLKRVYQDDSDDVMRLQAQLALEELNENMKNFAFPQPQLNMEKKIVMLD